VPGPKRDDIVWAAQKCAEAWLKRRAITHPVIYNIDPIETPFQAAIGKSKAEATLHEWQTQSLAAPAANAVLEGDDTTVSYTFAASTATVRVNNRCQISRKDVVVSGTQDVVSKAGRAREIVYQMMLKNKELRRDIEFVLTNNQAPVTGNTTTARQLRPLLSWYATNVSAGASGANGSTSAARTDGTQRPLTESLLKSQLQSIWTNGGNTDLILCGAFNKTVISGFTGNNTRTQDTSDKRLISSVDVYESDFGVHRIKASRISRDRDLHLLMSDMLAVAYLRPIKTVDLARTGDNEKGMLVTEYTLEVRNEKAHGLVADLTTA
jgi:hypothetical protein